MVQLVFATNNRHKLEEVEAILGSEYKLLTPQDCGLYEDIPEEQPTLEGNASQKSCYIFDRTGKACFADDTGLEVEALDGEPGVYSARYAGETKDNNANIELLLSKLAGATNRKARFRTVISYISSDGSEFLFEGVVNGVIITERSGEGGFGYDPIFRPDGYDVTFAQMDMETKNNISHRGRATQKFAQFLKSQSAEL